MNWAIRINQTTLRRVPPDFLLTLQVQSKLNYQYTFEVNKNTLDSYLRVEDKKKSNKQTTTLVGIWSKDRGQEIHQGL